MIEPGSPKQRLARRRRANAPGGRRVAHQVKVTEEEEARLVALAGEQGVSVPRLLVESALSEAGETPSQRRRAMAELFALRRQLAGVATNINQIAHAVNTDGRMPVGSAAAFARVAEVADRIDVAIEELARP